MQRRRHRWAKGKRITPGPPDCPPNTRICHTLITGTRPRWRRAETEGEKTMTPIAYLSLLALCLSPFLIPA